MTDHTVRPAPDFLRRDAGVDEEASSRADIFLETHRVSGAIALPNVDRRLVDILNAVDGPMLPMRDATIESHGGPGGTPLRVGLLHVRLDAILIAAPESTPASPSGREAVEKRPAAASLVLPGLEVTGHLYLPPEADPEAVHMIGRKDFLPVTHAEITQPGSGLNRWRQPLVVVNLGRLLLYSPAPR